MPNDTASCRNKTSVVSPFTDFFLFISALLQFSSLLNLKGLASGVLRLPGCHGSWQVSQRLPLPPTWAPGILATEQKEKKKKNTGPVLCNSLQFWETRTREAIDTTALGCSSGTFPFIDTNMVVKSLDSNPRQT